MTNEPKEVKNARAAVERATSRYQAGPAANTKAAWRKLIKSVDSANANLDRLLVKHGLVGCV